MGAGKHCWHDVAYHLREPGRITAIGIAIWPDWRAPETSHTDRTSMTQPAGEMHFSILIHSRSICNRRSWNSLLECSRSNSCNPSETPANRWRLKTESDGRSRSSVRSRLMRQVGQAIAAIAAEEAGLHAKADHDTPTSFLWRGHSGERLSAVHDQGLRANNRAENSYHPVRRPERKLQRFKSPGSAQHFLSIQAAVQNVFYVQCHLIPRRIYKEFCAETLSVRQYSCSPV